MKNNKAETIRRKYVNRKIFLFLTAFLITLSVYSQVPKVNITPKKMSIRTAFEEIEKQTGSIVAYNESMINVDEIIDIDIADKTATEAVQYIIKGKKLGYLVKDTYIIIVKDNQSKALQTYTGTIRSQYSGLPLAGASVFLKEYSRGAFSDYNGRFSIEAPQGSKILISFLGYEPQEIEMGTSFDIKVKLVREDKLLNETVVVGYGLQKKSQISGATETVNFNKIAGKPVISLAEALTGETTGLTVMQPSNQPGYINTSMHIRGIGTWGNSSPLVLVDGIAINMFDVAPADVESVTILKDAASTAIYGSRAANGVILITTKKGNKGKNTINYTANVGYQAPTRRPQTAESWQYAELYNQSMANNGKSSSLYPSDRIERMKEGGDPDRLEGNTNWFNELLKPALMQDHNLTLEGGSEDMQYLASVGYTQQEGVIASSYNRYTSRLNVNFNLRPWLKIAANISYINDKRSESSAGASNAYYKLLRTRPNVPVKFSDGTWSFDSAPTNPVRMVSEDYGMQYLRGDKTVLRIAPEISLLENWYINALFGYETKMFSRKRNEKKVQYDAFEPAKQSGNLFIPRNTQYAMRDQHRNMTASLTSSYESTYGKHYIKTLLGADLMSLKYEILEGSRSDFLNNDDLGDLNAGDPLTSTISGRSSYSSLASVFGRINYIYNDKYLFEVNLRYDGSSKFYKGNRWGIFPSLSAGWVVSEENFYASVKRYINFLKLRTSWGILGNQNIGDYLVDTSYNLGGSYIFNNSVESGYKENIMGNPAITWEKTRSSNIGIDFYAIGNKLSGSIDIYKKVTKDILLRLEAPAILGILPAMQNAGSVENTGWEVSLAWRGKIKEDFTYSVGASLADVRNKITDLKGYQSPTNNLTIRVEGSPIDAIYGWRTLGICKTKEQYEQYNDLMQAYDPQWDIGDLIIEDRDKNGKITSGDKTIIGNQIPRYTYSANLRIDYRNFDFYCLFQGVGKRDGFIGRDVIEPLGIFTAYKEHYTDSFNPLSYNPNMDAYYPRILGAEARYNYENFSHWVQDASYLRLKNIQLGYTFSFLKQGIKKLRLYFSGQNLFTITKYRIYDPENGLNTNSYPNVAAYSLGANLTF